MKRIIAGAALALPLGIASLPSQAWAFEVIINPHVHHEREGCWALDLSEKECMNAGRSTWMEGNA